MNLKVNSAMGLTVAGTEDKYRCGFLYGSLDDACFPPVYPASDCYNSRGKAVIRMFFKYFNVGGARRRKKRLRRGEDGGGE